MPIVIKEICVRTTVEKRELPPPEFPDALYAKLKEELLGELAAGMEQLAPDGKRRER